MITIHLTSAFAHLEEQSFVVIARGAATDANWRQDPDQMSLFMPAIATIRTVLRKKSKAKTEAEAV